MKITSFCEYLFKPHTCTYRLILPKKPFNFYFEFKIIIMLSFIHPFKSFLICSFKYQKRFRVQHSFHLIECLSFVTLSSTKKRRRIFQIEQIKPNIKTSKLFQFGCAFIQVRLMFDVKGFCLNHHRSTMSNH